MAFQRAKQQLVDEGFVHEWKEQGAGGLWRTQQLASNVPLSAEEVATLRQVALTGPLQTAGEPEARSVDRHPDKHPKENTSNPPPPEAPEVSAAEAPEVSAAPEVPDGPPAPEPGDHAARDLIEQLRDLDPRLRVPRGMLSELAALAAQWLRCGHSADGVRAAIGHGLPAAGQTIHRPGGLLRYLLRHVPPVPAAPPPPRVALMRECTGSHTQPCLFRPVADEELCPECRRTRAEAAATGAAPMNSLAALHGAAAARAAMRGAS
ncbi:hypothetical protein [Streptomyces sp. NPDC000410]|uniref:hypothetical protein n=1 Tax=Streptomyces sp. NPDC000410 TaxID=3154254 RepID=UPI00332FAE58